MNSQTCFSEPLPLCQTIDVWVSTIQWNSLLAKADAARIISVAMKPSTPLSATSLKSYALVIFIDSKMAYFNDVEL